MKALFFSAAVATALLTSIGSYAQTPASAPAGSTGLCNDGSYSTAASKSGACSAHKGVKEWFSTAKAATPAAAAPTPAPAAGKTSPAAATSSAKPTAAAATPAAGGPGQVWVNTSTKVYHCPNTKYYGKTKAGSYMSEADAKSKGNKADHGKACS